MSSIPAPSGGPRTGSAGTLSFCLVTTFYPPASFGGDAVHVQRVAHGLAVRGHRVRVVHNPGAYHMLGGRTAGAVTKTHPGVEVVPLPQGPLAPGATTATYLTGRPVGYHRRLMELTEGFDVVHVHNPSLLGGPRAFELGDADALRLYTALEHWLLCPTHVLFRYGKEVCEKRTCWRCTVSYRRPPQLWRSTSLLGDAVRHLDALIAPSRFTSDLHAAAFPGIRVETLPLLFWPDDPPPTERRPRSDRPLFVFAGRLEPIKGADRLVRSFARVRGADLVVAGSGSQAEELARLAAGNPAIRLVGRLPHESVIDLIRSAAAVVVPSVGYETFGGIAVECMALGTPAVVRALGPLPELIEDGGGLAFADDDQLVDVLQSLVDDPGLRRRLADAAPACERRFGTTAYFSRYYGILAEAATRRDLDDLAARVGVAATAPAGAGGP
ncbi:MAG: glycosyltransferase [Acidimicrobiales bacterium]